MLKLKQMVGRLLRSETDRGRITVLDPRLASTRWGRQMLDSLPPFRVEEETVDLVS
jgi:ATP-dependent DNA helicase DinG